MHALETDDVLKLARQVRRLSPDVPIVIGGHTAAAFPEPFLSPDVAAVVLDDGERAVPRVVRSAGAPSALATVPGLALRDRDGSVIRTAGESGTFELDEVPLPARHHVDALAPALRVPGPSTDLAGGNGARLPVPLLVLFDLAAARARRARALDRLRVP